MRCSESSSIASSHNARHKSKIHQYSRTLSICVCVTWCRRSSHKSSNKTAETAAHRLSCARGGIRSMTDRSRQATVCTEWNELCRKHEEATIDRGGGLVEKSKVIIALLVSKSFNFPHQSSAAPFFLLQLELHTLLHGKMAEEAEEEKKIGFHFHRQFQVFPPHFGGVLAWNNNQKWLEVKARERRKRRKKRKKVKWPSLCEWVSEKSDGFHCNGFPVLVHDH